MRSSTSLGVETRLLGNLGDHVAGNDATFGGGGVFRHFGHDDAGNVGPDAELGA